MTPMVLSMNTSLLYLVYLDGGIGTFFWKPFLDFQGPERLSLSPEVLGMPSLSRLKSVQTLPMEGTQPPLPTANWKPTPYRHDLKISSERWN